MHTQFYKGYTLSQHRDGVHVFRRRKFITWFLNMDQAKRALDEIN